MVQSWLLNPVVDFVMRTITLEVQLSESSIPMVDE